MPHNRHSSQDLQTLNLINLPCLCQHQLFQAHLRIHQHQLFQAHLRIHQLQLSLGATTKILDLQLNSPDQFQVPWMNMETESESIGKQANQLVKRKLNHLSQVLPSTQDLHSITPQ